MPQNTQNSGAPKDAPEPSRREVERLELLRRIADGDQIALGSLYDSASGQVYGLALRIVTDPALAEEVTLEVFTQIWKKASVYDVRRGSPSAWILTMARSRAIDRLRSGAQERKRAEPLETIENTAVSTHSSPEDAAVDAERRAIVGRALTGLPPEQRTVIELAYFGGLSHSEISENLGQPLGTVKTRIRLGMNYLRDVLSQYREEVQ